MPNVRLIVTPDSFVKREKASIVETQADGLSSGTRPHHTDHRTRQISPTSRYQENMSCVF